MSVAGSIGLRAIRDSQRVEVRVQGRARRRHGKAAARFARGDQGEQPGEGGTSIVPLALQVVLRRRIDAYRSRVRPPRPPLAATSVRPLDPRSRCHRRSGRGGGGRVLADVRGPAFLPAAIGGMVMGLGIAAVARGAVGHPDDHGARARLFRLRWRARAPAHRRARGGSHARHAARLAPGIVTSWKADAHDGRTRRGIRWPPHRAVRPGLVTTMLTASLALRLRTPLVAASGGDIADAPDRARNLATRGPDRAGADVRARRHGVARGAAGLGAAEGAVSVGEVETPARGMAHASAGAAGSRGRRRGRGAGIATSALAVPAGPRSRLPRLVMIPAVRHAATIPSPLQSFRTYVRDLRRPSRCSRFRGMPRRTAHGGHGCIRRHGLQRHRRRRSHLQRGLAAAREHVGRRRGQRPRRSPSRWMQ